MNHLPKLNEPIIGSKKEMSEEEKRKFIERCRFAMKIMKYLELRGHFGRYQEYLL